MIERTLVLIKPDGVQRGLIGQIISRFERCGLKIIAMKMVYASKELAGKHYADDEAWMKAVGEKTIRSYKAQGKEFDLTPLEQGRRVRQWLMNYISSSPIVALAIEGHNAVKNVRKVVGPTVPGDAPAGTIRGDFSFDTPVLGDLQRRPIKNLIHASGTAEEAEREIRVWFRDDEIHAWKRVDEDLFYEEGVPD